MLVFKGPSHKVYTNAVKLELQKTSIVKLSAFILQVFGVVFVVDSCNSQRIEELKEVFQQVAEHSKIMGKPFLV